MKVTAPLFSLDASGSIGGAIVASKWKGRNYMRRLVIPANPQTAPQTSNRAMMAFLSQAWAAITGVLQAEWEPLAAQGNFSPFNAFTRSGLRRWTQFTYPFEAPSEEGDGTIVTGPVITAQGGVGQISGSFVPNVGDADRWFSALYMNLTNDSVIAKEDLRLCVEDRTNGTYTFAITGIAPGTYYVKGQSVAIGGDAAAVLFAGPYVVT